MSHAPPHRTHEPAPLDAALVWFRRDLRASDQAALYHALKDCRQVWCAFVFDTDILQPLLDRGLQADRRVEFIHESLLDLDEAERIRALGWRGPVLLLEGCFEARDLEACSRLNLWHVIHRDAQIDWLARHKSAAPQRV